MNTSITTKKKLMWVIAGAAFTGLGISMPSCPGEQAMQQQMESLQAKSIENSRRAQQAETQAKALSAELATVKQGLNQVITFVNAQKAALDQLTAEVQAMKKPAKGGKAAAPAKKPGNNS